MNSILISSPSQPSCCLLKVRQYLQQEKERRRRKKEKKKRSHCVCAASARRKMSTKGREIYSQLTTTFTVLVSGEAMSFPAPHSYSPAASRVIAVMFIFSPVQVCLAEKGREKGTHAQTLLESRGGDMARK